MTSTWFLPDCTFDAWRGLYSTPVHTIFCQGQLKPALMCPPCESEDCRGATVAVRLPCTCIEIWFVLILSQQGQSQCLSSFPPIFSLLARPLFLLPTFPIPAVHDYTDRTVPRVNWVPFTVRGSRQLLPLCSCTNPLTQDHSTQGMCFHSVLQVTVCQGLSGIPAYYR